MSKQLEHPWARVKCPHPGCDKMIRAKNEACREHRDWSSCANPPRAGDFALKRNCKLCGKQFIINNPRNHYCPECHVGTCVICGNSLPRICNFTTQACSSSCASRLAARSRSRTKLTCQQCGKEYYPSNGHLHRMYCNNKCKYDSMRKYPDGSDPTRRSWEYKHWRRQVFKHDDYTCQRCGAQKKLHAHHIKTWEEYPNLAYDPQNGLTLCRDCHTKEHGRIPMNRKGVDRLACANCEAAITGTGKSPYCKSCAMKLSPKAIASRYSRARDENGQFVGQQ